MSPTPTHTEIGPDIIPNSTDRVITSLSRRRWNTALIQQIVNLPLDEIRVRQAALICQLLRDDATRAYAEEMVTGVLGVIDAH